MKWIRSAMLLVVLGVAAASGSAWAHGGGHGGHGHGGHGGHFHGGVFFSAPLYWPYYPQPYYYPYYPYYPYPYYPGNSASSSQYIEQGQAGGQQYWYYCNDPQGYYPYVKNCPGGWQQVSPRPADN